MRSSSPSRTTRPNSAGRVRAIVTQVVPRRAFYAAEDYHQDYLAHHLTQPYIVYNDLPKVENLKTRYPELYRP